MNIGVLFISQLIMVFKLFILISQIPKACIPKCEIRKKYEHFSVITFIKINIT